MYKVVIVDDECWTRDAIKHFVDWKQLDLELVGEAEDGESALQLIGSLHPDIVITDMSMPVFDGVSLLRQLEIGFPRVKVIVVSGYEKFEYTKQAIKSKVTEYILKPIGPEELNNALKRCLTELKAGKREYPGSFMAGSVMELEALNLVIRYKTLIRPYLLELNLKEIKKLLAELCISLRGLSAGGAGNLNAGKVYDEFISLVEDYVVRNEHDMGQIIENIKAFSLGPVPADEVDMLEKHLTNLFDITIVSVMNKHKQESRKTVYKVKNYIDNNYSMDLTLNMLANAFFVSKEYLSKAFKTEFKKNVTGYIVECRMEIAKKLICSSSMQLKSVAVSVGYEDLNYFYKIFKKYYGVSPGQMRQSVKTE